MQRLRFWHSAPLGAVPGVVHGVSTRLGGVSKPPFATLNMGLATGDRPSDVVENRRRWLASLGFELDAAVYPEQVHANRVAVVERAHRGMGAYRLEDAVPGVDALVTREPGVVLAASFADCLPILFADAEGRAVGVAHAGWRGTLGAIAVETVKAFEACGIPPGSLRAALGPCIKPCCYEVGDDLFALFREQLGPDALGRTRAGRPALDLAGANRMLLVSAGVDPRAIDVSPWCTACRTDLFFSHRAERGRTGRIAAAIGIVEGPRAAKPGKK